MEHQPPSLQTLLRTLIRLGIIVLAGIVLFMAATLLSHVRTLLTMIILAVLLGYVISPPVRFLTSRTRLHRSGAVAVVYFAVVAVACAVLFVAAPSVSTQAHDLLYKAPVLSRAIEERFQHPTQDTLLSALPTPARIAVGQELLNLGTTAVHVAQTLGMYAVFAFRGGVEAIVRAVLVLLITFFVVVDAERIVATGLRMVQPDRRPAVVSWLAEFDSVVGGFVRGQLLVGAATAVAAVVVLEIFRVPYALLLGAVAGVASVIPLAGPIVGIIPAVLVAAASASLLVTVALIVAFVVILELQAHVLQPLVIGRAVRISPFAVLLAILAGAEIDGLLGVLIAIPAAGVIRVALDRLFQDDGSIGHLVDANLFGVRSAGSEELQSSVKGDIPQA